MMIKSIRILILCSAVNLARTSISHIPTLSKTGKFDHYILKGGKESIKDILTDVLKRCTHG